MREHIKNGEYPNDLRFILLLYRKVKQETDSPNAATTRGRIGTRSGSTNR